MLEIEIENDRKAFKPGEQINGVIKWQLDDNPEYIELSILWMTSGAGTTDAGIVKTLKFENPGSMGEKDFEFTVPAGPYSFSGKLISILWCLELTVPKTGECVRSDIIISPTEEVIECRETITDSTEKKLKNKIFSFSIGSQ